MKVLTLVILLLFYSLSIKANQLDSDIIDNNNNTIVINIHKEEQESVNVFLITFTIIAIVFSTYLFQQFNIKYLPNSIVTIVIGMIVGLIIKQMGIEANRIFSLDGSIFFLFLLPPIIFESGYNLHKGNFFGNIASILAFAVFGTLFSTFVIGIGLAIFRILPLTDALAFGSLISSVDPVAALCVFNGIIEELGEKKTARVRMLIFGESTLNDVAAMMLFRYFDVFARLPTSSNFSSFLLDMINHFLLSFFGSLSIGVLIGLLSSLIFKYFQFYKYPSLEMTLMFISCYIPYVLCDALNFSGILGLLSTAIINSHYTRLNLSKKTQITIEQTLLTITYLCETIVFLYLGIISITYDHQFHFGMVLLTIIFCIVGRMANIFPISYTLNNCCGSNISLKSQVIMCWSGMRGVISLALAIGMAETQYKPMIVTATLVVVVLSIVVFGGGMIPVLRYIYSPESPIKDDIIEDENMINSTNGELSLVERFDRKYFQPFFIKNKRVEYRKLRQSEDDNHSVNTNSDESSVNEEIN
ncbi:hypothetical protein ABK040_002902 [Willaertia magna]